MAVRPSGLYRHRLAITAARARSAAAAAGELTPEPHLGEREELDDDVREALLGLLRPGGAYWESSGAVSSTDPDLS